MLAIAHTREGEVRQRILYEVSRRETGMIIQQASQQASHTYYHKGGEQNSVPDVRVGQEGVGTR